MAVVVNKLNGFTMPLYMQREQPQPLDASSIWTVYDDALNYAKTNAVAYLGQTISVYNPTDKSKNGVYRIDTDSSGNTILTLLADLNKIENIIEEKILEINTGLSNAGYQGSYASLKSKETLIKGMVFNILKSEIDSFLNDFEVSDIEAGDWLIVKEDIPLANLTKDNFNEYIGVWEKNLTGSATTVIQLTNTESSPDYFISSVTKENKSSEIKVTKSQLPVKGVGQNKEINVEAATNIITGLKLENNNIIPEVININDLNLGNSNGDFTTLKGTIDYSQSAEPTLNTSKEDTVKGHISYLAKSINWIKKNAGTNSGTGSGTNIIVDSLPETGVDGEQVIFKDRTYTWYNGKWNSIADDLGGREETFEEEFVFQPTANDLSIRDGYAKIKKIKGRSIVWQNFSPETIDDMLSWTKSGSNAKNYCSLSKIDENTLKISWTQQPDGSYIFLYKRLLPDIDPSILCLTANNITIPLLHTKVKASAPCTVGINTNSTNTNSGTNLVITESEVGKWLDLTMFKQKYNISSTNFWTGISVTPQNSIDVDIEIKLPYFVNFSMCNYYDNYDADTMLRLFPFRRKLQSHSKLEINSLNLKGLKANGFNQYDGEKAKVIAGQTYYLNGDYSTLRFVGIIEEYDVDLPEDRLFTPRYNGYLYATGDNICINFTHSGYRNGEYEKYKEYISNINNKLALSEIKGKLNSVSESVVIFPNGLRSAGEAYDEITSTSAIKRIKSVLLTDLEWNKDTGETNDYFATIPDFNVNGGVTHYNICTTFCRIMRRGDTAVKVTYANKPIICRIIDSKIAIYDAVHTTLEDFISAIQGHELLYETDTPEEYVLDTPLNLEYAIYDFGTEEIIADQEDENVPIVPLRADIQYGFNAVDEIRNNRFKINELKKKVQELSSNNNDINNPLIITAGGETLVEYSPLESATLELSKVATSGSYEDLTNKPSFQLSIEDLENIRSNASNGNTAYGWGNHANAGYAIQSEVTEELNNIYNTLLNKIPTELPPTDNSVTNAKIADNSISTSKIQDKAIIGSKIGYQEISTDHIANNSITNAKLVNRSIMLNGTPIVLGGIGQISGLVTANGHKCFLEIANNELILSSPTFAENGSIATVEEIVRYPLYTELPTIPNPTANATEITDVNNWFNPNINSYIIPEDLMYEILKGNIPMSQMLLQSNNVSCTLTSYNLDFRGQGVDMTTLITDLITREGYDVYVENDIDNITISSICTLKFKIDGNNIIIECYKKIV